MLTEKEIEEIQEHLEKSQSPLFFFDNDLDGLASFLILARAYGKGKGVAIKSSPDLTSSYLRKIEELNPDCVFVLDKPLIAREFIEGIKEKNLPLIWIDHHEMEVESLVKDNSIYYYNSKKSKEMRHGEPVTYLSYKITGRKEDLWLAMAGCISDNYLPDFADKFEKEYPELWKSGVKTAFQAFYETEIGKIARILGFALKDKTSNVIRMIKFLMNAGPIEVSEENFIRFKQIDRKYQQLIEKAKKFAKDKLLYFQYSGDLSISADIANELSYRFPGKIIVVVYIKTSYANISLRGKNVREMTARAIEGFKNATGGGHEDATGAKISLEDLNEFKKRVEELVKV